MVVNGQERDGHYFRIVADDIHLNPVWSRISVRNGWLA